MNRKIKMSGSSNAIRRKEMKPPNILIDTLNDYVNTSTIHGINYLGAKDKSIIEKIWWFIMFLASVSACLFLISQTWTKWKRNPVILSFEKEQIPIWKIPFPAVTVCPLNKVDQSTYNYTEIFQRRDNLSGDEYKEFWDVSLICNLEQYEEVEFKCNRDFTDENALEAIRQVAPKLDTTMFRLRWLNKRLETESFAELTTEDGLCFTFNSFRQQDIYTSELDQNVKLIAGGNSIGSWTLENGYVEDDGDGPFRTARNGVPAGLILRFVSNTSDTDFVCGPPISGYKIILHNPVEPPRTAEQYFVVPSNREAARIIQPELITTSKNLRSMSPNDRKCYFSDERSLKFFKVYTQNNCRLECDANATKHYCGCVPFFMPRDNKTLTCGFGKMDCVRDIETIIIDIALKGSSKNKSLEEIEKILANCECRPSCTSLHYTAENSFTETHFISSILKSGLYKDRFKDQTKQDLGDGFRTYSKVVIFFKEPQFLSLRRSELYGKTDFLANCGGLLGLFMGVSILSLLEIVYFLTLRLWCNYKNRNIECSN